MHVADDELLPGDGYDDLLKPFRTIEDTHVLAAAVGWDLAHSLLCGAAWDEAPESTRRRWERDRPLLDIARHVRAARLEAAWRAISGA